MTTQASYKRYHDRTVRVVPAFSVGQFVFVDRAPGVTTSEPYNKLLPESVSPFEVLNATLETVTIEENGLSNTVSIDRVTIAPDSRIIVREDGTATDTRAENSSIENTHAATPTKSLENPA